MSTLIDSGTETVEEAPQPPLPRRRVQLGARGRASLIGGYLLLLGLALIYIYPFLISVASS